MRVTRNPFAWTRVWRTVCWTGAVGLVLAAGPLAWWHGRDAWQRWESDRIDPLPASDEEQAEIVRLILASGKVGSWAAPPLSGAGDAPTPELETFVLVNEFVVPRNSIPFADGSSDSGHLLLLRDRLREVPPKLFREWAAVAAVEGKLRDTSFWPNVTAIIGKAEYHQAQVYDGVDGLIVRHHVEGVVEVSRAALSADRSHALIYLIKFDGMHFGDGFFYVARDATGWRLVASQWNHYA